MIHRLLSWTGSLMTSPSSVMKAGKPVVHWRAAGRVSQPVGYEIENPYRWDVKVSVSAGGVIGDALGDGLGEAVGDGDGLAVG
jgi:hypothetical protein